MPTFKKQSQKNPDVKSLEKQQQTKSITTRKMEIMNSTKDNEIKTNRTILRKDQLIIVLSEDKQD